jgi:nicotinamidase-related amidase
MSGHNLPPSDPGHYPRSQTALLFLDYQNILINMIGDEASKQKLIDSAKALLAAARKNDVPIIHCLADTNLDPPQTNQVYNDWITIHKPILEGMPTLGAEFEELAPTNTTGTGHESVSTRPPGYRSAFVAEDLLPLLQKELGVTHLILGGIATSGAVLGTATHGTELNFVVTVVEEAVWDPNTEVHRNLLNVVFPSLAWVSNTEQALKYLE